MPSIVSEPVANYVTPDDADIPEGLEATEMPTPKRPKPRAMGFVEPSTLSSGASEEAVADSTTSARAGDTQLGGPAPPSLISSFDSLAFDDNPTNTGGGVFIPADPIGAAGPAHVVSVTNVSLQFHDKDGTELLGPTGTSLSAFFTSLSCPPMTGNFLFDPKVLYDQDDERFVIVAMEREDTVVFGDPTDDSRILLAVSDDEDPTGTWFCTTIASKLMIGGLDRWADYPGFASDEEALYITANMFAFGAGGGAFGGTRLWVVDKFTGAGGGFYGGGTATISLFDPYAASPDCLTTAPFCGTSQPAHVYGEPSDSAPNIGTWFSYFSGLTAFGTEFMQVMRLDDPIGPGPPTFFGPEFVSLGDIDDLGGAPLPDAPQMGTAETLETNDRRTLDSVWINDSLYVTTTIDPEAGDPDDGEATAHWVHMDTSVLTGSPPPIGRVDQGGIGGEDIATDTHTFFPSIAVNTSGDVVIGFSASAATIFPGSYYTARRATDAAGTNRGSVTLTAGVEDYIRTFDSPPCEVVPAENRWGDYSGAVVDPVDQCFWIYNQFADVNGAGTAGGCNGRPATEEGRWGTSFGRTCLCKDSFSLPLGEWKQISMSCDQTDDNRSVGEVFGDDLSGTYTTDWIVKSVDPVTGLNTNLTLDDEMNLGQGYWIKTNLSAQVVENQGVIAEDVELTLSGTDTDGTGCGSSAGHCNMAGHPHTFDVCWEDVEILDGISTLDLDMADPAGACQGASAEANGCIMSRVAYKWTGSAYAPFDGTTPLMEGTLVPFDGFWVSAVKDGIRLRVPAAAGNCGPPERGEGVERGDGSWAARLIVSSGELEDLANAFGQLSDSVDGYDSHDLLELFPLDPYLSVVFPHPEWEEHANDYTSDFHQLRSVGEPDSWDFEVRSSDPSANVTLRWEGPAERLLDSILTDLQTGEQVAVAPDGSYNFTMTDTVRSFRWSYVATLPPVIFEDGFESGDTSAWKQ